MQNSDSKVAAEVLANPPVFNPVTSESLEFAEYRADAIARCLEQRRDEGQGLHHEHALLLSEAMSYAWKMVGAGKWSMEDVEDFRKRLVG